MKYELDYIEKLVKLVSDNELTELTLEDGDNAIVIRKEKEVVASAVVAPSAPIAAVSQTESIKAAPVVTEPEEQTPKKGVPITSPMVGTFYSAATPGTAPFVEVGKSVNKGQVVCIIEAMKLMNEIESEVSGKIVEVCVQDGQPVEYGQTLMMVEP